MTAFVVESWIWYAITITTVVLRVLARYLHFGSLARLQIEDWFMVFIACLYTILIASLNVCAKTNSNLIDPNDIPSLTPQDISDRIYGSKMILVVEQCMCAVQWGTKACLLMLYWRLTENFVQGYIVKGAAVYVAVTYIVMEVLYFSVWCRPFHDYWQTPTDNVQCTTALHHLIVNLAFNLTSDLLIMSIPLPLLLGAHLEVKRKILLIFPFSLGFFSIVCAILSKHLSFTQPFSAEWVYWYTREASTVMIVSNMPYTWGLARRVFNIHSFFGSSRGNSRTNSIALIRTRDTGMEMIGGQVRELRGIPVIDEERSQGNTMGGGHEEQRDRKRRSPFDLRLWNKKSQRGMQRLPSIATAQEVPMHLVLSRDNKTFKGINLHSKETGVQDEPTSGSNSGASDGQSSFSHPNNELRREATRIDAEAINRLYRLDDDDLAMDIEKERKRSDARDPG